jgi:hypothetical protein
MLIAYQQNVLVMVILWDIVCSFFWFELVHLERKIIHKREIGSKAFKIGDVVENSR